VGAEDVDYPAPLHTHAALGQHRLAALGHDTDAVREYREIAAPLPDEQRAVHQIIGLTDEGEWLVRLLEGVALDAAEQSDAVVRGHARQRGKRLSKPTRDQDGGSGDSARGRGVDPAGADLESAVDGGDRLDLAQVMLDARIRCELGETEPAQLVRRDAVASEEAVRDERDRIARSVAVEHDHPPSSASEVQRGGESGRAGTDDDDIGVGVHKRFRSLSSRASVDSLPRISIDSNSGGLIRLPLIAVRSGPKAARGLS